MSIIFINDGIIIIVSIDEKQTPSDDEDATGENLTEDESVFYPIGWWGSTPGGTAGLPETYVFRDDGTFTFYYNEHALSLREIAFSGTWEQVEDTFFLTKLRELAVEGGELVPSTLSVDHYEIDGGEIKTKDIDPPEEIALTIGEYDDNKDGFYNYPSVFLNDIQYWRIYESTPPYMDDYWK